ncbi:hypothetical protein N9N28_15625 [Rubripirellula amarantea]|nr:hypothetical protein [Rubripirellula amarantea]
MRQLQIEQRLTGTFRIEILGSTSFHDPRTKDACTAVGRALQPIDCVLITGGLWGIPQEVSRGFNANERVFHLLPYPWPRPSHGITIRTGWSMLRRRKILAQVCNLYVCVEGGPGTAHETRLIRERNAPIIPLGAFGGHSKELYLQLACPEWAKASSWNEIGNASLQAVDVVAAMVDLISDFLRVKTSRNVQSHRS